MARAAIERSAEISADGVYRYLLARHWGAGGRILLFVMLNPSTADAAVDDPTIRRCIYFATRDGYDGLRVVNLFALRATDPSALKKARDPIGPDNDATIRQAFKEQRAAGDGCVAAWGAHGTLYGRHLRILAYAREAGLSLSCLGKTKSAAPKHPLYMSNATPLVSWP